MDLPRYDPSKTYRWNYDHPPSPVKIDVPPVAGDWRFLGITVNSPLGIPAGPLLNGKWCLYYASLGFDVLTYKTVRSAARECYPLPNLLPVDCGQLTGHEPSVPGSTTMRGSWAVSFGMPSAAPDVWRRDIEWTRQRLTDGKLLSVSVVGSILKGWSIADLANDYAKCAAWAAQSGADCIEVNLSCPNVTTCDGQLYQIPEFAAVVVRCVRESIRNVPLLVKIGHVSSPAEASALLNAIEPSIDGLAMTNSVAMAVTTRDGFAFDGQRRGICGQAIRQASLAQVRMFSKLIRERRYQLSIVACGGAQTAEHVSQYLDAGASAIHIATAAMIDPQVGIQIKRMQLVETLARH
jgi:dihydroorotate dehydrogenase